MTDAGRFNHDAFLAHARAIAKRFEGRRLAYLKQLKWRCALAAVLLVTFPMWFGFLTNLDAKVESISLSALAAWIIHIIAGTVIVIGILVFAAMPLFRYRYFTMQLGNSMPGVSGIVQQPVSLKEKIFSELFSFFGDFTLSNNRKLALRSFRDAPDMPEFDEYISEDYIQGRLDSVSVEMAEIKLAVRRNSSLLTLFNGLFILLDINSSNLALHGKFSGKTVVIADRNKSNDYVAVKYQDYKHIEMADASFNQHFDAFTTDSEEAAKLLSPGLLRPILKLSDAVRHAKNQVWHIDDRLAYAISGIARHVSDVMAVIGVGLLQWFRTGSFRTHSTRFSESLSETAVSDDARALNSSMHCAFFEDKVLVSIPYQHDLFEPETIFHPPLTEDDIKLVWEMMTMLAAIATSVVASLPKEVP